MKKVLKKYLKSIKKVFTLNYFYIIIVLVKEGIMSNTELLQLKISPDLKNTLDKVARKKGLTITAYVRMILIESLKKE